MILGSLKPLSWSVSLAPLREKDPFSLIVSVLSCGDNSMSVMARATIVQDEKGVRVQKRTNNTRFCFGCGMTI